MLASELKQHVPMLWTNVCVAIREEMSRLVIYTLLAFLIYLLPKVGLRRLNLFLLYHDLDLVEEFVLSSCSCSHLIFYRRLFLHVDLAQELNFIQIIH